MRIAVLGCGPAGMFAAHAAAEEGHTVDILSKARKSFMRWAQYLHEPIPGLSGDPFKISYELVGEVDIYRNKVYGDGEVQVSVETLVGVADAWDIREAYDAAWSLYEDRIFDWDAASHGIPSDVDYELVFSTIPAKALCQGHDPALPKFLRCEFSSQMVLSTALAASSISNRDNVVVCSGDVKDLWYRTSRIHGWETSEYGDFVGKDAIPTGVKVWEVEKPISTDCRCHPWVVRSGRYGKWTKGVLAHESYNDMKEALQ